MTSSDDGLWPIVKAAVRGPHWQRIESAMTGAGVPDLNGCYTEVEVWVELKSVRAGLKIKSFTPLQAGWMLKRAKRGGRVWMLVRHRHEGGLRIGPPVDNVLLYPGGWARELMEHGIRVTPMASWDLLQDNTMGWDLMSLWFHSDYPPFKDMGATLR